MTTALIIVGAWFAVSCIAGPLIGRWLKARPPQPK